MDLLRSIIHHFPIYHRNEFELYCNKLGVAPKELELFSLIHNNPKIPSKMLQARLYPDTPKRNSYDSLRKRLIERIVEFAVKKCLTDKSMHPGLDQLLFCRYMMGTEAIDVIKHFVKKTETAAKKNRHIELLGLLYKFQIDHAVELSIDLPKVMAAHKENNRKLRSMDNKRIILGDIRIRMDEARLATIKPDPNTIIDGVLEPMKLTKEELRDPDLQYRMIYAYRSALASTKEYTRLEPYVLERYNDILDNGGFGKGHIDPNLAFLYVMAHACYRNRKFQEALTRMEEMYNLLPPQKFKANKFYAKYIALQAAVASFSGRNDEAIAMLKKILKTKLPDIRERANMQLNLAVYYFQAERFEEAHNELKKLDEQEDVLIEKMGLEWMFKKKLIHIITYYERNKKEVAKQLLIQLRKGYGKYLALKEHDRVKKFLKIVLRMCNETVNVRSSQFRNSLTKLGLGWTDYDDLHAVSFFCWLKSKMIKRKYYEILIERVNEENYIA